MGNEIQQIFDVELIRLTQRVTPVIIALVLAFALARKVWVKRVLLLLALVYSGYLAEAYVAPGMVGTFQRKIGRYVRSSVTIPPLDKHAADRYLIALVGRDYFTRLFIYHELESKSRSTEADIGEYRLVYQFLPLREYQEDDLVELVVRNGFVVSAYKVPNCVFDPTRCQFEVLRPEALEIAKKQGVSGTDVELGTTSLVEQGLAIEVKSCEAERRVLIDYRDGEVISVSKYNNCD